ncbi:hypothetical protein DNI05_08575 [Salmonella enterica subsp. enterica serovar Newport]|nr:hypothetical protein [Salmonella enterica subsp. enterica serovar Newport]
MFNKDSYLYQCIEMRGVVPTTKNIHDIFMHLTPELRQKISAWGVNDQSLKEQINDELDNLI